MRVLANSWAARASSQFLIKLFIFSSIEGYFVCSKARGIATGIIPSISSKWVFSQSACHQLLWVNSIIESMVNHSSGLFVQNIEIYASISWFTRSVAPSDCGWYAVVKEDLILSSFRSSKKDLAANWGPLSEIILSVMIFPFLFFLLYFLILIPFHLDHIPFLFPCHFSTRLSSFPLSMTHKPWGLLPLLFLHCLALPYDLYWLPFTSRLRLPFISLPYD